MTWSNRLLYPALLLWLVLSPATAAPIECSGAELKFERVEDNIGGSQSDLAAALAAKGLKLAEKLVGTGITIIPGSVKLDEGTQAGGIGGGGGGGEATPSAIFTGGAKTFGSDDMAEGIVLSTGNVGCRLCDDETKTGVDTSFAWGNAKTGNNVDADFRGWCKEDCGRFQDMVSLEFKFRIDVGCKMKIKYVFTSEEWPRYVSPLFADSFAFFVGDSNAQNYQNIALTPQGEAVSIQTVNCVSGSFAWACSNCNLFYDNSGSSSNNCPAVTTAPLAGKGFALKGMTKLLEGEIQLAAGIHTIKLVIADARDTQKDSAVFVAAKSMTAAIPMCYTVVSKVCGEVKEQYIQPVTKFPSGHPVMTRTNCDGQPTSDAIPGEGKNLAGAPCGKEAGGSMFYAYDGTQSRSGYAKKGKAIVYVVRDSWKRAYLVIELGQALTGQGYATMNVKLERVTGNPGILVQDDAGDKFTWDSTKNSGKFKWAWDSNQGDGVVIGPFIEGDGWCLEWTLDEQGGLDGFIFGSYENNAFVEKVLMTADILENGVRLCGCAGVQDTQTGTSQCQACDKRDDGKTCGGIATGSGTTGTGTSTGTSTGSGTGSGNDGQAGTASGTTNSNNPGGGTGGTSGGGNGTATAGGTGVGNDGTTTPGGEEGAGGAVVVVMLLMCCCCFVIGMLYLREKEKGPFQQGGKLAAYGKNSGQSQPAVGVEMSETGGLPPGWTSHIDEASGYPVYTNTNTNEVTWDKPVVVSNIVNPMKRGGGAAGHGRKGTNLPPGWGKDKDADGNKFYYNAEGAVQWEAPPGSTGGSTGVAAAAEGELLGSNHARSATELPSGWEKDIDADGNKFYYNAEGAVQWEAPEGSTGGSAGGGGPMLAANHARSGTELPTGWEKDIDGEGNKYYYDEAGATSWTAPEGSTKDGQTHPDLHF